MSLDSVARTVSGVVSSIGSLTYYGMCNFHRVRYWMCTTDKSLNDYNLYGVSFVYVPEIDSENFLIPHKLNPYLLIPTKERALVLYQRDEAIVPYDDEHLMMGLDIYRQENNNDFSKLYEVADFYNRREEIEKSISILDEYLKEEI